MHVNSRWLNLRQWRWKRAALPTVILGFLLTYQNCGPYRAPASLPPVYVSPFAESRVRIDASAVRKKGLEKPQPSVGSLLPQDSVLNVVVDNPCVQTQCVRAEAAESVICPLVQSANFDPKFTGKRAVEWHLPQSMSAQDIEALLQKNPIDNLCTKGVSQSQIYHTHGTLSDPDIGRQYYLDVIRATSTFDFFDSANLPTVIVAIIDTGVDATYLGSMNNPYSAIIKGHPDLLFPYTPGSWSKSTGTVCNSHGTVVAGIIGAAANNGIGGRGIAKNAGIISYQIGDCDGRFSTTEIYNALEDIVWHKKTVGVDISVVNMSLGGGAGTDYSYSDAFVDVIAQDILIVTAAGNNSTNLNHNSFYPASFHYGPQINVGAASPQVVTSGSLPPYADLLNSPIHRDSFSNYGDNVIDIAAPGTAIYSTALNKSYSDGDGTSFAAPMVTAAAVLARGYLQSKGILPSATMLKQIVLSGARSVSSMTESDGSKPFLNNNYLDLGALKTALESYVASAAGGGATIGLDSSSVSTDANGNKMLTLTISVSGFTPEPGMILKLYTNQADLAGSFTGQQCDLSLSTICTFTIPYTSLLLSTALYLTVTDASGRLISSLSIPLTQFNFGSRDDAALDGEVVAVTDDGRTFTIEGWACLVGFPDSLDITATIDGSAVNQPLKAVTTTTKFSARGEYYTRCKAPTIQVGFRLELIETTYFYPAKISLVASHPSLNKSIPLRIYSYQPGAGDTTPASYSDAINYEPAPAANTLSGGMYSTKVQIANYEFKNWILKISGSVCVKPNPGYSWLPPRPNTLTVALGAGTLRQMFPELSTYNGWSFYETAPSVQSSSGTVMMQSRSFDVRNPNPGAVDGAGMLGCCGGFSDIYNRGYLSLKGVPASDVLILNTASTDSIYNLVTVTPNVDMGDGCPFPSGFNVNVDVRPYIQGVHGGVSVRYLSSAFATADQALQAAGLGGLALSVFQNPINRGFDQLLFNAREFSVALSIPGSGAKVPLTTGLNGYSAAAFFSAAGDWSHILAGLSLSGLSTRDESISHSLLWGIQMEVWSAAPGVVLAASSSTSLNTVYTSPTLTLPRPGQTRLFFAMSYLGGTRFGTLNRDLVMDAKFNDDPTWYQIPLDLSWDSNKKLLGDVDLPVATNKVVLRVRSTGANAFTLDKIGIGIP